MKDIEKIHVDNLMMDRISKNKFLRLTGVKKNYLSDEILELLEVSFIEKSSQKTEIAIYLVFKYELLSKKYVVTLNSLLVSDWHEQHENIAMLLQEAKNVSSVEFLHKAIGLNLNYLDYDEAYALEVKCIWALGDIGNDEAKEKLQHLVESRNKIISSNAKKQLSRIEASE